MSRLPTHAEENRNHVADAGAGVESADRKQLKGQGRLVHAKHACSDSRRRA